MKILIAGATGVLGRRVVRRLVEKRHDVVGLSRSEENALLLESMGGVPFWADLFNEESLVRAAAGCDAVLHLATAIPSRTRSTRKHWRQNDRIRREGTLNLVCAARRNLCGLYVQQSITLLYGERRGEWVDERVTLPAFHNPILQSAADMEKIVTEAAALGLPSLLLRFGSFYSHDSIQTRAFWELLRKGHFPVVGTGAGYVNPVSVDDAASAVVRCVEQPDPGRFGIFNVCDDEPVPFGELVRSAAEMLAARKPRRIPAFLAKAAVGRNAVNALLASVRCRNAKFRETYDWAPVHRSFRDGYPVEIRKWLAESETVPAQVHA